jgi:hypothetical protein
MPGEQKSHSQFLGVPIDELLLALEPEVIKARMDDGALVALNEKYTTQIKVTPPELQEPGRSPIRAAVQITTELPDRMQSLFRSPETTVELNSFAALGALTAERDKVYVGSRLTIFESEDAWEGLHLPLLLFATICATEAIFGAAQRSFAGEVRRDDVSDWTENDLELVYRYLSNSCFCNSGGLKFAAEFGLLEGAVGGDDEHKRAQFHMVADEPHLELGGGLFCILQMPHELSDEDSLKKACVHLNNMEMAARDQPPHFGAWCIRRPGRNPVYVSFFPNEMHQIPGIAVNAALWAIYRAQWANSVLASLGVHA